MDDGGGLRTVRVEGRVKSVPKQRREYSTLWDMYARMARVGLCAVDAPSKTRTGRPSAESALLNLVPVPCRAVLSLSLSCYG